MKSTQTLGIMAAMLALQQPIETRESSIKPTRNYRERPITKTGNKAKARRLKQLNKLKQKENYD